MKKISIQVRGQSRKEIEWRGKRENLFSCCCSLEYRFRAPVHGPVSLIALLEFDIKKHLLRF